MKILVLGVGAQGSTVAQLMDKEANVSEIICADYDRKAVDELVKIIDKGRGAQVDATNLEDIVKVAEGVDLIVNALPLRFGPDVLEAALRVKANYQDFAATDVLQEDWVEGIRQMYTEYGRRFAEIGKAAIISTGSAPGMICVVSRDAVRHLDSCDTINMLVWEGVIAKRFLPFWWSPEVAISDMSEDAYAFIDGEVVETDAYSLPVYRTWDYVGKEVRMVEHAHDEPVIMGLNADKFFKGAKNIYFKYGGAGIEFAEPLYKMGMLSEDPYEIDGVQVVPKKLVLDMLPAAPKYREEIKEILDEGLELDSGAFVVEAIGMKDGKKVIVETHLAAPGCVESFEKSGMTAEMYLTGQSGALFTKLFADGKVTQKGLISSDMLEYDQVDYYLKCAADLEITLNTEIKEL